jgi:hypothetical protein
MIGSKRLEIPRGEGSDVVPDLVDVMGGGPSLGDAGVASSGDLYIT